MPGEVVQYAIAIRNDGLGDLRKLYADIDAEAGPSEAWLGVCIALVTAPEFMAY